MSIFDERDTCCGFDDDASVGRHNRPGLGAIEYRIATHARFKEAMLRELTSYPALQRLTTRDDDDATIALIDGWAGVLDVLTFYQERIANEGFLGTATERVSILHLARAIGYELNPGVAASAYLAFTVEASPGADEAIAIGEGLKVQSIPGQDEDPQTFETIESITARPAYNAMRPRLTAPQTIGRLTTHIYLDGLDTGLQAGDLILLVGSSREAGPYSERWDARTVHEVTPVAGSERSYTIVSWEVDLGHTEPRVDPAEAPTVHAFRRRASLFGYNAPDWRAMPETIKTAYGTGSESDWPDFENQTVSDRRIDLDLVYPEILPGSWVLMDKPGYRELYRAEEVFTDARSDYTLTGKTTSMTLDARSHLSFFPLRESSVFAASEELARAERDLVLPVFGDRIELGASFPELDVGRVLIVCGTPAVEVIVAERVRVFRVGDDEVEQVEEPLQLVTLDGSASLPLETGDVLTIVDQPTVLDDGSIEWTLQDAFGVVGLVQADEDDLLIASPENADETNNFAPQGDPDEECEVVTIRSIADDGANTVVELQVPLTRVYHRSTLAIHGNVVAATHGEARSEVVAALTGTARTETLGSGDGSLPMQQFTLTQTPLTYVSAATASGGQSTLEVRVDGIEWTEVASLYGQAGDARVYSTRMGAAGHVTVKFGDGTHGARLPTGRDNISATYRVGTGLDGNVRKEQLALLMSRPLGVKDVVNPLAASGAQDPEDGDDARDNAPLTVLTLDRIVSARDFEDFARAFAGIAKAQATVLWSGERQLVHITVAGSGGTAVEPGTTTFDNLKFAIDGARHTDQEVRLDTYQALTFGVGMRVVVEDAYEIAPVLAAVCDALTAQYAFDTRAFAESVTTSEIAAIAQDVEGVRAVLLDALDGADPIAAPTIAARRARWDNTTATIEPAELLTIEPDAIFLEGLYE